MNWKVEKVQKIYPSAHHIEKRHQVKLQCFWPIANIMKIQFSRNNLLMTDHVFLRIIQLKILSFEIVILIISRVITATMLFLQFILYSSSLYHYYYYLLLLLLLLLLIIVNSLIYVDKFTKYKQLQQFRQANISQQPMKQKISEHLPVQTRIIQKSVN